MMERKLKTRLEKEMLTMPWFSDIQHRFKRSRSTVTNLIEFFDDITDKLDNGEPVDILYFNMAKAFDTVLHTNLIAKMRSLNVSHYLNDWIENYLPRRQQQVVIKNVKSPNLEVHRGVPQGSV